MIIVCGLYHLFQQDFKIILHVVSTIDHIIVFRTYNIVNIVHGSHFLASSLDEKKPDLHVNFFLKLKHHDHSRKFRVSIDNHVPFILGQWISYSHQFSAYRQSQQEPSNQRQSQLISHRLNNQYLLVKLTKREYCCQFRSMAVIDSTYGDIYIC